MRELKGYSEIKMYEFSGESLAAVLCEAALFIAKKEEEMLEFHLLHEWNEEDGHIIFLYAQQ